MRLDPVMWLSQWAQAGQIKFMTKSIEDYSEILQLEEPLSRHTWLRLGGPAQYFLTPRTEEELLSVVQTCREQKIPIHILGSGSNLLVPAPLARWLVEVDVSLRIQCLQDLHQV